MCLDCDYHRRQQQAGNRDGKDKLGTQIADAAKRQDGSHEKIQIAMADGAKNIGRRIPLKV